jgi:hypothetical protein
MFHFGKRRQVRETAERLASDLLSFRALIRATSYGALKALVGARAGEIISADDLAQTLRVRLEGLDSFTFEIMWHDARPPPVLHVYAHGDYSGLVLTAVAGMDKIIVGLPRQSRGEQNGPDAQLLAAELGRFLEFSIIPEA